MSLPVADSQPGSCPETTHETFLTDLRVVSLTPLPVCRSGIHFFDHTEARRHRAFSRPPYGNPLLRASVPSCASLMIAANCSTVFCLYPLVSFGALKPATHRRPKPATRWGVLHREGCQDSFTVHRGYPMSILMPGKAVKPRSNVMIVEMPCRCMTAA